ncbi:MAG TPA: hypothetical protein VHY91_13995 [Pirellulales bacterium]|jgi:hypothetical protein|nr:hypothetical protein [Pirellulales bacterium]
MFPATPVEYLMVIAIDVATLAFWGLIVLAAIKYFKSRAHRDRSASAAGATRPN